MKSRRLQEAAGRSPTLAIARALGTPWQRCTAHFLRDLRGHAHRDQHDALRAVIRSILITENGVQGRGRLRGAICQLELRLPRIAALIDKPMTTSSRSSRSRPGRSSGPQVRR
jgi:transposase-like protein